MRKLVSIAGCAAFCLAFAVRSSAEGEGLVKIGGHMKGPVLFDTVKGRAVVNGVKTKGSYSAGSYFGAHAFIMYVSKDINDTMSVHCAPDFGNAGAGATPVLGTQLGEGLKTTAGTPTLKFNELTFNMNVPAYGVQMRAGYMSLPFIQDYGKELFWHEEHNAGKFTLGNAWHDTGIEIYKSLEAGPVSLPLSFYVVNGNASSNRDNNNSPAYMLHAEPEFAGVKAFGSVGGGMWGDKVVMSTGGFTGYMNPKKRFMRWSYGAAYSYKRFTIRGEAASGKWDDNLFAGKAQEANKLTYGYYGKIFYTVVPGRLTAMYHYDRYKAKVEATSPNNHVIKEKYKTNTVGLQYEMAPAATLIFQYDVGDWKNDDVPGKEDSVVFTRALASLRVTF